MASTTKLVFLARYEEQARTNQHAFAIIKQLTCNIGPSSILTGQTERGSSNLVAVLEFCICVTAYLNALTPPPRAPCSLFVVSSLTSFGWLEYIWIVRFRLQRPCNWQLHILQRWKCLRHVSTRSACASASWRIIIGAIVDSSICAQHRCTGMMNYFVSWFNSMTKYTP